MSEPIRVSNTCPCCGNSVVCLARHEDMRRPSWASIFEGLQRNPGLVQCGCGRVLHTIEETRSHWQLGHMDTVEPSKTPPVESELRAKVDAIAEGVEYIIRHTPAGYSSQRSELRKRLRTVPEPTPQPVGKTCVMCKHWVDHERSQPDANGRRICGVLGEQQTAAGILIESENGDGLTVWTYPTFFCAYWETKP